MVYKTKMDMQNTVHVKQTLKRKQIAINIEVTLLDLCVLICSKIYFGGIAIVQSKFQILVLFWGKKS